MRNVIVSVIVGLAVTAAPAFAKGAKKAAAKPMSDRTFVTKAAEGGMAEVELGKLAEQKGTNDQVKSFGRRMVEDHSKANDELKTLAQSKSITLPTDLDTHTKRCGIGCRSSQAPRLIAPTCRLWCPITGRT